MYTLEVYVANENERKIYKLLTEAFNTQHIPYIHSGTHEMTGTGKKGRKEKCIDITVTLSFNKENGRMDANEEKKPIHFLTE